MFRVLMEDNQEERDHRSSANATAWSRVARLTQQIELLHEQLAIQSQ